MLYGDSVSIQWPQTRCKIVWLLFSFSPTPPQPHPQPLQPQPLSDWTDTDIDTSPSPSFQLTRPKTGFSTPILPDMSLGHLGEGGNTGPFLPYVGWSCFLPSKKKERGLTRLRAKGTHLVAHDLACHNPSAPAPIPKQQIPHQTNHCRWCSTLLESLRGNTMAPAPPTHI